MTLPTANIDEVESSVLDACVVKSWATLPEPPLGMTEGDIIRLLLASSRYDMNPSTFLWEGSSNITYQSLWTLCQKLSARGSLGSVVSSMLAGRSSAGYLRSRGIGPARPKPRGTLLRDNEQASIAFESIGIDIRSEFRSAEGHDDKVYDISGPYVEECIEIAVLKQCSDSLDL